MSDAAALATVTDRRCKSKRPFLKTGKAALFISSPISDWIYYEKNLFFLDIFLQICNDWRGTGRLVR